MNIALLALALASVEAPKGALALMANFQSRLHDAERTAVCVSGELRTHYHPHIQSDYKKNFHRSGYEYFYSSDVPVDPSRTALNPIRAVVTPANATIKAAMSLVPGNFTSLIQETQTYANSVQCAPGSHAVAEHKALLATYAAMTSRYVDCYREILAEEEAKGFKYDYVMRIRPDNFFNAEFPSPRQLLNKTGKRVLFFDDHISLAARQDADVILWAPWKVTQDCHTPADCKRVCQGEIECTLYKCGTHGQWLNLATKYYDDVPSHRVYRFFNRELFEVADRHLNDELPQDTMNELPIGVLWPKGHKGCGKNDIEEGKNFKSQHGSFCYLHYWR